MLFFRQSYVHRIGRCGRAGHKGTAISFFTSKNSKCTRELIRILKQANQKVCDVTNGTEHCLLSSMFNCSTAQLRAMFVLCYSLCTPLVCYAIRASVCVLRRCLSMSCFMLSCYWATAPTPRSPEFMIRQRYFAPLMGSFLFKTSCSRRSGNSYVPWIQDTNTSDVWQANQSRQIVATMRELWPLKRKRVCQSTVTAEEARTRTNVRTDL